MHLRSLAGMRASRWTELFGQGNVPKGRWRSLYKPPIEKRSGDLQWRLVHGAIATNRHKAHLDPTVDGGCIFCSESETVAHLFLQCSRLRGLFSRLGQWVQGLGEVFSNELFVFGPKYSLRKKNIHTMINFISGTAKMAIWLTRKNKTEGAGSTNPVQVLEGLVAARLRVEFAFYKLTDNLETFSLFWAQKEVLCAVRDDELCLSF